MLHEPKLFQRAQWYARAVLFEERNCNGDREATAGAQSRETAQDRKSDTISTAEIT